MNPAAKGGPADHQREGDTAACREGGQPQGLCLLFVPIQDRTRHAQHARCAAHRVGERTVDLVPAPQPERVLWRQPLGGERGNHEREELREARVLARVAKLAPVDGR